MMEFWIFRLRRVQRLRHFMVIQIASHSVIKFLLCEWGFIPSRLVGHRTTRSHILFVNTNVVRIWACPRFYTPGSLSTYCFFKSLKLVPFTGVHSHSSHPNMSDPQLDKAADNYGNARLEFCVEGYDQFICLFCMMACRTPTRCALLGAEKRKRDAPDEDGQLQFDNTRTCYAHCISSYWETEKAKGVAEHEIKDPGASDLILQWPGKRVDFGPFPVPTKCTLCKASVTGMYLEKHLGEGGCTKMEYWCPNHAEKDEGGNPRCSFRGKFARVKKHIRKPCPNRAVQCKDCNVQVRHDKLATHSEEECRERTVECAYCDKEIKAKQQLPPPRGSPREGKQKRYVPRNVCAQAAGKGNLACLWSGEGTLCCPWMQ